MAKKNPGGFIKRLQNHALVLQGGLEELFLLLAHPLVVALLGVDLGKQLQNAVGGLHLLGVACCLAIAADKFTATVVVPKPPFAE